MRKFGRVDSVDVSIGFPPFSISGSFTPTRAERLCAWELLVELMSRTSVAPLRSDEGSIREAMSSLYTLYGTTRELMRKHGPDVAATRQDGNLSLGLIAMRVLNDIIRPVLSKWHPALEAHEAAKPSTLGKGEWERAWDDNAECRESLNQVRRSVRSYIDTLGRIAGTPDIADAVMGLTPAVAAPRARPDVTIPEGFKPRRHMVRWLSVVEGGWIGWVKLRAAKKPASGPATSDEPTFIDRSDGQDLWFDFVADLGDAFDPTMAVAWQLGRASVRLPGDPTGELPSLPGSGAGEAGELPRGRLLALGGDQVYPAASGKRYLRRFVHPYQMAFEGDNADNATMVAIPGNHDWMGGIGHFRELFVGGSAKRVGRWKVEQREQWFAVKLPCGWWLWGLDTGLSNKLGDAQTRYFQAIARTMQPGDRVILMTPVPLWQMRAKAPEAYYELRQQLSEWLNPASEHPPVAVIKDEPQTAPAPTIASGPAVHAEQGDRARSRTMPVFLSGDSHYFAVYEGTDPLEPELHITSGGGGAFLHPTHSLAARVPYERGRAEFELRSRWPNPADSRTASPKVRLLGDRQSLTVVPLVALLHGLFSWLASSRLGSWSDGDRPGGWPKPLGYVLSSWPTLVFLLILAEFGRLATVPNARERLVARGAKWWGLVHGVLLAGVFWLSTAAVHWAVDTWLHPASRLGRFGLFSVGSLLGGAAAYAVFLAMTGWLCDRYRINDNLAFAAVHSGRYKHFVRSHISADGSLTMYAVGVDPIGKGWAKALRANAPVPPPDPNGVSLLHYVWGTTITAER